jgi:DNA-binding NtrC family response regulator
MPEHIWWRPNAMKRGKDEPAKDGRPMIPLADLNPLSDWPPAEPGPNGPQETVPSGATPAPTPGPQTNGPLPWDVGVEDPLQEAERFTLIKVLEQCEWNFKRAADRLHLSRSTLYAKVGRFGIKRD